MRFFLFGIILLLCYSAVAQKKFSVSIKLPKDCHLNRLQIFLDDGKTQTLQKPLAKENKLFLSGLFYSKYAGIILKHPHESSWNYQNSFFLTEKSAVIKLLKCDSMGSPFERYKLKNAYDFSKEKRKMEKLDSMELKALKSYFLSFRSRIFSGKEADSVYVKEFQRRDQNLYRKDLEYIQQNSESYYAFWFFRRNIVPGNLLPPDSILSIFNKIFPEDYKESTEGLTIRSFLEGKQSVKKNGQAPQFVATDINGRKISLNDFWGKKHILLTFWAAWCVPCIKEFPALREIHQKYSPENLEIISISYDSDYNRFIKVVNKEGLVWTNIFNDVDLINSYGGHLPIPRTYLIDKTGKIIYDGSIDDEGDFGLPSLRNLLFEIFQKK